MLILRLLNYISGYKDISVSPRATNAAVNLIVSKHYDGFNMKRERDGELHFSLLNSEYKKFINECEPLGIDGCIRVDKEHGLPYLLRRYRKRLGIPIGILIFLILTKISTLYIWDIKVSGNDILSDAEIIDALEQLGCSVGAYIPSVDMYGICHRFLLENDGASWISVNMVGTTARVEIIEKRSKRDIEKEGNGTPTNLIASCDGTIVRTETSGGMTVVRAGEAVKKGQLLVSGTVEIGKEEDAKYMLVRSRARVYAETNRCFSVEIPFKRVKKTVIGRKKVYTFLKFFGKSIKLKENSSILETNCDIIEDRKRIVLFDNGKLISGIPLPISLNRGYTEEYAEEETLLSEEEALLQAKLDITELFSRETNDAECLSREESYEIKEQEDGKYLVLTWKAVMLENIAEEVPIGID